MNKEFENLCKMAQKSLKKYLREQLPEAINADGFLFYSGTFPVLLVAHLDTVHKELPKEFVYKDNVITSPQGVGGDDRCGVYMILEILKNYDCSVLFCEDEEIGSVGAQKFLTTKEAKNFEFNYIIELDRRGTEDAVFYDCENDDFENFITQNGDWKTNFGTFTDISVLAPAIGCAAVNFSCGYNNEHTLKESVDLTVMEKNIGKVCELLKRTTTEDKFKYIAAINSFNHAFVDDFDYEFRLSEYEIIYLAGDSDWCEYVEATSQQEAIGIFLIEYSNLCYDDILCVTNMGGSLNENQY